MPKVFLRFYWCVLNRVFRFIPTTISTYFKIALFILKVRINKAILKYAAIVVGINLKAILKCAAIAAKK